MFLRSQLVSRLPVTALRLYCHSVPSTSSSASILSPSSNVLSRLHIHTTATITSQRAWHFGLSLGWTRGNRKDFEEAEEVKGARTKHTDDSNSSSNKGGPDPTESEKRERAALDMRMNGTIAFQVALAAFGLSMILAPIPDGLIPPDAPHVSYATFIGKYLWAGQIQKIILIRGHEKAVATLHAGAIVDGKPAKSDSIVINCPNRSLDQFKSDVSEMEAEMGISHAERVDIQLLNVVPPWKEFILFGGFVIMLALAVWHVRSMHQLGDIRVTVMRAKSMKSANTTVE